MAAAGDTAAGARAARSGTLIGSGLARALGFNGATLLLLALFAVGCSLLFGISWLRVMERIGAGVEALIAWIRTRVARRRSTAGSASEAAAEREHVGRARCARKTRSASRSSWCRRPPAARKSERVVKEKQRPLFTDMPDSPLPPLSLLEEAPPRQETVSNETLEFTSRLIERKLADFGVERQGARGVSGPGDHALRDRARGRRQGRADRQPDQGSRARAVGGIDPRGRDHSRQVVHGPRAAQSAPADGQAGRDPVLDDVQRHAGRAHARARQGHRRQARGHRPVAHAAPAGGRHHRARASRWRSTR